MRKRLAPTGEHLFTAVSGGRQENVLVDRPSKINLLLQFDGVVEIPQSFPALKSTRLGRETGDSVPSVWPSAPFSSSGRGPHCLPVSFGTSFRGDTVTFFSSKRLHVRGKAVHVSPGFIYNIHSKRLIYNRFGNLFAHIEAAFPRRLVDP